MNKKLNEYYKNHGFENKGEGEEPYPYKLWERKILWQHQKVL